MNVTRINQLGFFRNGSKRAVIKGTVGTCLEAAKAAYVWAEENPSVKYVQPDDCNTGDYGDSRFTDEFFLASVELAIATGDEETYDYQTGHDLPDGSVPSWHDVGTLGLYSICAHPDAFPSTLVSSVQAALIDVANTLKSRQNGGYGILWKDVPLQTARLKVYTIELPSIAGFSGSRIRRPTFRHPFCLFSPIRPAG